MTNDEMRIAIAEDQGYYFGTEDSCREECWRTKTGLLVAQIPNCPEDLNAMHEVEETITDHTGYWQWIERIQGGPPLKFSLLHATARQRAEAYLRTKGLWK